MKHNLSFSLKWKKGSGFGHFEEYSIIAKQQL